MDSCPAIYVGANNFKYGLFLFMSTAQGIFCPIGFVLNSILLIMLRKMKTWPKEVQIFASLISIFNLISVIGFLILTLKFDLPYHLYGKVNTVSALTCQYYSIFQTVGGSGSIFSISVIGAERFLTSRFWNQEQKGSTKYIYSSICVSIVGSIFTVMACIGFAGILMPNVQMCFCFFASSMPSSFLWFFYPIYFIIVIVLGAGVYNSLRVSRIRFNEFATNRAIIQTLNQRYRLWENIRITDIFFPTVLVNSLTWAIVITIGLIDLTLYVPTFNTETHVLMNENRILLDSVYELLIPAYTIAHPCLLMYKAPLLRPWLKQSTSNNTII